MTTMPFGQHKGTHLSSLPDDYVHWLLTIDLREPLRTHIQDEYRARSSRRTTDAPPQSGVRAMAIKIIDSGYRKLALEHHPDAEGSTHTMQVLNEAIAWLRERVAA